MSQDRLVDKIRKLFAMANDERGNEQERETALRQAHALLVKHNLDVADVGSVQAEEAREEHIVQMSVYPWARNIAYSVAGLFFCAYYFQRGAGKSAKHAFIGKQSNAVTASEMAHYIVTSVFKELRARYGSETSPEARSFAMGVDTAIRVRCRDLRRAAEEAEKAAAAPKAAATMEAEDGTTLQLAAPATGRALVLASLYTSEAKANEEWLAEHVGPLKTQADRTKDVKISSYAAGKAHGSKISLSRQVTGTSAAKRIK